MRKKKSCNSRRKVVVNLIETEDGLNRENSVRLIKSPEKKIPVRKVKAVRMFKGDSGVANESEMVEYDGGEVEVEFKGDSEVANESEMVEYDGGEVGVEFKGDSEVANELDDSFFAKKVDKILDCHHSNVSHAIIDESMTSIKSILFNYVESPANIKNITMSCLPVINEDSELFGKVMKKFEHLNQNSNNIESVEIGNNI